MAGRVLVTGGAGFVGSHVVDALLTAGYSPFVLDNLSTGRRENLPPDVPLYVADIRDGAEVDRVVAEVRPRYVFHLAAQISVSRSVREPDYDADVNILGFLRVLEACVRHGVERVVFASSGGTLYGEVTHPATEDSPLRPISPYGLSKLAGEQYLAFYARTHGLKAISLRYANVYGPRQDPHGEAGVVAIFTRRLLAGQPPIINGDGRYVRDYVYVEDVARAHLQALAVDLPEPFAAFNVGTGVGTDVNRLEQLLREAVLTVAGDALPAPPPPPQYGPPRPGDLRSSILSPDRARQVLGFEPQVSLPEGLRRTVRWFAEHR
ncbi:MAG: NAD-dependent epimerase/dehydratase family protein [Firmicutes bacterium]|nr:NAD-dependent epimerase/dehydratase family protein [Bacillota bacterium]